MELVFVQLGRNNLKVLRKNINFLLKYNYGYSITIIHNLEKLDISGARLVHTKELENDKHLNEFNLINELDTNFRNGFWQKTSQRLFYVKAYLFSSDLKDILHVENDSQIFISAEQMKNIFRNNEKVSYPMESQSRGIASIIFFPKNKITLDFFDNYLDIFENTPTMNEMDVLGKIKSNLRTLLPSNPFLEPEYSKPNENNYLFDPSTLGYWLFGQDPRNQLFIRKSKFELPDSAYSLRDSDVSFQFSFRHKKFELILDGKKYIYANVHIHSKKIILSDDKNYIQKLNKKFKKSHSRIDLLLALKEIFINRNIMEYLYQISKFIRLGKVN